MENDLKPFHEEEFYIQGFREIKADIEMWVATNAINGGDALSANEEAYLLQSLAAVGPRGKNSADILGRRKAMRTLYKNARCRIPFIRHIIALFLYDHILEPFAFGFTPPLSQALLWIDSDIISCGFSSI